MNWRVGVNIFLLWLGLMACQKDTPKTVSIMPAFFDLPDFFKKEQETLSKKIIGLSKKITINGRVEEQRLDSFDLSQELAIFIAADINRPAWLDQYQIDTLKDEQGALKTLKYKALTNNLKTKELVINYKDGEVEEIYIKKVISTMAAASSQELTYYKGSGYTNKNERSMVFSEANAIQLDVKFLE